VPVLTSVNKATHNPRKVKPAPGRPDTKAIRIRLIQHGWTMTELAKRTDYARPYVSQLVHGRLCRSAAQARIARTLGMAVDRAFPKEA
jgi:transcriptional regulator with XRE-family HTH domain